MHDGCGGSSHAPRFPKYKKFVNRRHNSSFLKTNRVLKYTLKGVMIYDNAHAWQQA
jgi:hypothetical protein